MKKVSNLRKLTISALVIALYVVIMYITQNFAFGQYQIRIATGLYALAYQFPFLIIPLALANLLSNLVMGGLGLFDIIGGFFVGLITTTLIVFIKKLKITSWLAPLPIAIIPAFVVPIWLSIILEIPYWALVLSLSVGQIISAYTLGLLLVKNKSINKICESQYR